MQVICLDALAFSSLIGLVDWSVTHQFTEVTKTFHRSCVWYCSVPYVCTLAVLRIALDLYTADGCQNQEKEVFYNDIVLLALSITL